MHAGQLIVLRAALSSTSLWFWKWKTTVVTAIDCSSQ